MAQICACRHILLVGRPRHVEGVYWVLSNRGDSRMWCDRVALCDHRSWLACHCLQHSTQLSPSLPAPQPPHAAHSTQLCGPARRRESWSKPCLRACIWLLFAAIERIVCVVYWFHLWWTLEAAKAQISPANKPAGSVSKHAHAGHRQIASRRAVPWSGCTCLICYIYTLHRFNIN